MNKLTNKAKGMIISIGVYASLCDISYARTETPYLALQSGQKGKTMKSQVINGGASINNEAFRSLTVNGGLTFNNMFIEEALWVNGGASGKGLKSNKMTIKGAFKGKNVEAKEAVIKGDLSGKEIHIEGSLEVDGDLHGVGITVIGITTVRGDVSLTKGIFGEINVKGKKIEICGSKVRQILVKGIKDGTPKVILKNNTIVSGDIIFESCKGEVYLMDNSVVKGKVAGRITVKKGR